MAGSKRRDLHGGGPAAVCAQVHFDGTATGLSTILIFILKFSLVQVRCAPFERMLDGGMLEASQSEIVLQDLRYDGSIFCWHVGFPGNQTNTTHVNVLSCNSYPVVLALLEFLYTDQVRQYVEKYKEACDICFRQFYNLVPMLFDISLFIRLKGLGPTV